MACCEGTICINVKALASSFDSGVLSQASFTVLPLTSMVHDFFVYQMSCWGGVHAHDFAVMLLALTG